MHRGIVPSHPHAPRDAPRALTAPAFAVSAAADSPAALLGGPLAPTPPWPPSATLLPLPAPAGPGPARGEGPSPAAPALLRTLGPASSRWHSPSMCARWPGPSGRRAPMPWAKQQLLWQLPVSCSAGAGAGAGGSNVGNLRRPCCHNDAMPYPCASHRIFVQNAFRPHSNFAQTEFDFVQIALKFHLNRVRRRLHGAPWTQPYPPRKWGRGWRWA
jgi:hypothetical protein